MKKYNWLMLIIKNLYQLFSYLLERDVLGVREIKFNSALLLSFGPGNIKYFEYRLDNLLLFIYLSEFGIHQSHLKYKVSTSIHQHLKFPLDFIFTALSRLFIHLNTFNNFAVFINICFPNSKV